MGWATCGEDSKGRPIGYAYSATCDHPGCKRKIDRGLSYACGNMHGEDTDYCEGYFCPAHLVYSEYAIVYPETEGGFVCFACDKRARVRAFNEDEDGYSYEYAFTDS